MWALAPAVLSAVLFAIRSVLRGVLGIALLTSSACDDDPAPTEDAKSAPAPAERAVVPEPTPSGGLAWDAALARGVRPPQGDDATYEVDPFVAALVVETLRTDDGAVFVWTAAEGPASAGYRVGTVAQASLWGRLGLRSGDVVEALNGVALTGPERVEPALDGAEHQVTLTLFRDDLSFTARYRLEGGLAWRDVLSGIGPAAEPEVEDQPNASDASDALIEGHGEDQPGTAREDAVDAPKPGKPAKPGKARPSSRRPTSRPKTPPRSTPASSGSKSGDIRCASANACTIAKRTFDALVASPKRLQQQADIVPAIRNDVHSGYKIKRVTGGSAISKLGFRGGDKITHVNGRYLGDDAQAMALYFSLGSTRVFKIRYERGGAKRAKTVTVR